MSPILGFRTETSPGVLGYTRPGDIDDGKWGRRVEIRRRDRRTTGILCGSGRLGPKRKNDKETDLVRKRSIGAPREGIQEVLSGKD